MPKVSLVGLLRCAWSLLSPARRRGAETRTCTDSEHRSGVHHRHASHTRTLETDGTGTREMALSVRVLDEQAVRRMGSDHAAVPVGNRRPERAKGPGHKSPDGSIASTGDAGVQDLAVPPPGAVPVFLDLRQKAITVSALRPGTSSRSRRCGRRKDRSRRGTSGSSTHSTPSSQCATSNSRLTFPRVERLP